MIHYLMCLYLSVRARSMADPMRTREEREFADAVNAFNAAKQALWDATAHPGAAQDPQRSHIDTLRAKVNRLEAAKDEAHRALLSQRR